MSQMEKTVFHNQADVFANVSVGEKWVGALNLGITTW